MQFVRDGEVEMDLSIITAAAATPYHHEQHNHFITIRSRVRDGEDEK
jgi:hypothetical protein